MKEIIETLYNFGATLINSGYDSALKFINHLIPLEVIELPSGMTLGTWTVPNEWIVRDAWVKFNGEKIIDYQKQPLSLVVGSLPFQGKISLEELKKHLHFSEEHPKEVPYVYKFYEKDWGVCVAKDNLPTEEGEYEVFIDTEYKPGTMKIGVHTIKGTTDREILIFAHLDHPYQANDNLSGVACVVDLAKKIKADHTVKIIFCPETIGSIGYAFTQDISKVDFVIAVDICGNNNSILLQKAFDKDAKINKIAHLAVQNLGESYRKGEFRTLIGSDEYVFNDPKVGIPGIMLSRYPYPEYHTASDTPDKIDYEMIERTQKVILKIIELWEKDKTPVRNFSGPVMRSRYGIHTPYPQLNLSHDYLIYSIDGKKSVAELCADYALNFDHTMGFLEKMYDDGAISWVNPSEEGVKATPKKKSKRLSRGTDVSR